MHNVMYSISIIKKGVEKMRRIIDGRTYNTTTSREVGTWSNGKGYNDFSYCEETLYRNTKGAYFLHGAGGPHSKYSKRVDSNSWSGGEDLTPLSQEEAQQWAEERLTPDEYEAEFGVVEEAEPEFPSRQRINVTLDNDIIERVREHSRETGVPISRIMDRALQGLLKEEKQ